MRQPASRRVFSMRLATVHGDTNCVRRSSLRLSSFNSPARILQALARRRRPDRRSAREPDSRASTSRRLSRELRARAALRRVHRPARRARSIRRKRPCPAFGRTSSAARVQRTWIASRSSRATARSSSARTRPSAATSSGRTEVAAPERAIRSPSASTRSASLRCAARVDARSETIELPPEGHHVASRPRCRFARERE